MSWPMQRTPMPARKTPMPRGKPLAKVGKRAKAKLPTRRKVCAIVRARDVVCQVGARLDDMLGGRPRGLAPIGDGLQLNIAENELVVPSLCGGPLDVHERIPRTAWPDGELEVDNCLLVCRRHHDWIDDHPGKDEAPHVLGFHGYAHERPGA